MLSVIFTFGLLLFYVTKECHSNRFDNESVACLVLIVDFVFIMISAIYLCITYLEPKLNEQQCNSDLIEYYNISKIEKYKPIVRKHMLDGKLTINECNSMIDQHKNDILNELKEM